MTQHRGDPSTTTLAEVIYAGSATAAAPEQEWAELVRCVAASDPHALDALYERMAAPVFTLLLRTVKDRAAAEELTVDVFSEIWRRAARYDPHSGSVVAWIMNLTRGRASKPLRPPRGVDQRAEHERWGAHDEPFEAAQQERAVRGALFMLTADERSTIETTLLSGDNDAETAALVAESDGRPKVQMRSALGKLRLILHRTDRRRTFSQRRCERAEMLTEHVVGAVPQRETAALERHLADCADCRADIEELRHVVDALALWGVDILSPPQSVRRRLAQLIAADGGGEACLAPPAEHSEPRWNPVASGIQVKMLSADASTDRMSMLVRLAPGFAYPSHRHAGVEELHLLDGELWIDRRRLTAGDYSRAEPGSADRIVWSGTGCTCVLITSAKDVLH